MLSLRPQLGKARETVSFVFNDDGAGILEHLASLFDRSFRGPLAIEGNRRFWTQVQYLQQIMKAQAGVGIVVERSRRVKHRSS
jgi:hypothetical protein